MLTPFFICHYVTVKRDDYFKYSAENRAITV